MSDHRDHWRVVLASVIFGTSFPAIKFSVGSAGSVDAILLTSLRLGLGAACGIALLLVTGRFRFSIFRDPWIWYLGLLNAGGFLLQHVGEVYTTASATALLINVNVVFIAILMAIFYRERMTVGKALGVVLGLAGVAVLATRLDPSLMFQGESLGDLMVITAGLIWAFYVLYWKKVMDRGADDVELPTAVLVTTTVISAFALPWADLSRPIPPLGWAGVLWLGLVTTLPPLVLWTRSIRAISPTVAAIILLNEVAVATALSILFLGELLGAYFALGGGLIVAGVVLASRTARTAVSPGTPGNAT